MNPTTTPPSTGQTGSSSSGSGLAAGAQSAASALQNLPQRAREVAQQTREVVQERYEQVRAGAEEGLARGETYVREHPLPTVLGALALGTLLGFAIGISRREEPTFRHRLVDDPLNTLREAVITALLPTAERLHDHYDDARDHASKALDRASRGTARCTENWLHALGRAGNSLKFW